MTSSYRPAARLMMSMCQMNYRMAKVETLFMTTNPLYSFLSSSLVQGDRPVRRGRQRPGPGNRPVPAAPSAWPKSSAEK